MSNCLTWKHNNLTELFRVRSDRYSCLNQRNSPFFSFKKETQMANSNQIDAISNHVKFVISTFNEKWL